MNSLSQDGIRLIVPGLLFQGFDQTPAYPSGAGRQRRGSAPTVYGGVHVAGTRLQKRTRDGNGGLFLNMDCGFVQQPPPFVEPAETGKRQRAIGIAIEHRREGEAHEPPPLGGDVGITLLHRLLSHGLQRIPPHRRHLVAGGSDR